MSVFVLKIIAMITMLLDHIGYVLFPEILPLRLIGRIAFPIFAFLIAQGYLHTHDKKKYLFKIIIAAIITEIPFNLTFFSSIFYIEYQNVLILFAIALATLSLYENQKQKNKDGYYFLLLGVILTVITKPDYGVLGLLLIYSFYFASKNKENFKPNKISTILTCTIFAILELLENGIVYRNGFPVFLVSMGYIYLGVIISGILLSLYNTKLGLKNKISSFIFYSFYPLHIIIILIIKVLIK